MIKLKMLITRLVVICTPPGAITLSFLANKTICTIQRSRIELNAKTTPESVVRDRHKKIRFTFYVVQVTNYVLCILLFHLREEDVNNDRFRFYVLLYY